MATTKKTKIAATAVTGEAAIDSDGTSVATFVKKSEATSGLSEQEWFRRFTAGVQKFGKASGNSSLANANVTDAAGMQSTLDGIYGQGGDAYNNTIWPMMKSVAKSQAPGGGRDFFYDTGWQYHASADWPTKWTTEEPLTDAEKAKLSKKAQAQKYKDGSWLDKDGKSFKKVNHVEDHYVDPDTVPFIARHSAATGSIFKVSNPAQPGLAPVYAMVLDHSPAGLENSTVEVSPAVQNALGIKGTPNAADGKLRAEYLGNPGKPDHPPTFDEIQAMGKKLDKSLPPDKAADAGGSQRIVKGEPSVVLGGKQLPAAYADASCVHTGGGYVAEGSDTVHVGAGQWPLARVTDHTNDGYVIKTGEDSIEVG